MYHYHDRYLIGLSAPKLEELEILFRSWGLQTMEFYERVDDWFSNFSVNSDKELAHKVLLNFEYLTPYDIESRIKGVFAPVQEYLKQSGKSELDLLIAIPDEKGDSATRASYDLIKQWNITQGQIFELRDIRKQYLEEKIVVYFNDTHGSGRQFESTILPKLIDLHCKIFILCLTITRDAIINLHNKLPHATIDPDIPTKNAFDIFSTVELCRIEELGRMVYPKHPLGYGRIALLTAYYYQCPNNTLPIIWANGSNNTVDGASYKWHPLFEYKPKREPQDFTDHQIKILRQKSPKEEAVLVSKDDEHLISTSMSINLDSLPLNLSEALASQHKVNIAKQLEAVYEKYREEYRRTGNPILIYNRIAPLLYSIENLLPEKTIQIGKFHWFLSYLLIHSDYGSEVLQLARQHANDAIGIFENKDLYDKDVHIHLVKSYWLAALSHKMQGHFSDAHRMISDTIKELEAENIGGYFDTLYLRRQQTLIEEHQEAYNHLLKGMEHYKFDSIESYYTSKRIFEFAIKSQDGHDIDRYFNLTREHYQKASPYLEQVSKFSYWKYLFVYFKHKKQNELADRIYRYLLSGSIEKQLYGQQRTLEALRDMFN